MNDFTTSSTDNGDPAAERHYIRTDDLPRSMQNGINRLDRFAQELGRPLSLPYMDPNETNTFEEFRIHFDCPNCRDDVVTIDHLGPHMSGIASMTCPTCDNFNPCTLAEEIGFEEDERLDFEIPNIVPEWYDEPPVVEPSAEQRSSAAMPIFDHPIDEVNKKAREKWARDEGYAMADRARAAKTAKAIPTPVSLTDFLAEPDEDAEYRIEGLFPVGGRILLAAQQKAGKTTMTANLIRCLVDGDPFLDTFEVTPVRRVAVIDNELDERMIRRWIRKQGIRNTDRVFIQSIRGKVSSFNILDPAIRTEWANLLRGSDFLILDCLRPILDALGLSEDKDAGLILVAFDALLKEAGIAEGVMVHHMGHSGERTRGDSRLRDWPDATWKLVRKDPEDEASPRFFSAYGRDVDVAEAELGFDKTANRLSFTGRGSRKSVRKDAKADDLTPHIVRIVAENPGISGSGIERELRTAGVSFQKGSIGFAGEHVAEQGLIRIEKGGSGKPTKHFPIEPPRRS